MATLLLSVAPSESFADTPSMAKYGVNAAPWRTANHITECDQIIASGVKWVRMIPNWSSLEPDNQGVYNTSYLTALDESINRFVARDVKVILCLAMTPKWASSAPAEPWPLFAKVRPAQWSYWEDYVTFIAGRYKNKVQHWEIWNEPDYDAFWLGELPSSPTIRFQTYAELLKRACPKLKAVDPANKILFGGLAMFDTPGHYSYGPATFFDNVLGVTGASAAFDIVNYHSYGPMLTQSALYDGMKSVISNRQIQSKPVWVTEIGYSQDAASADLEAIKADMVDQFWTFTERKGDIERVFYHHYRNINIAGNFKESNFGFTTTSLAPLKALYHYSAQGGAELDATLQELYPSQTASTAALVYIPAAPPSNGSYVQNGVVIPPTPVGQPNRYCYYRVYDTWSYNVNNTFYADITYRDVGSGNFQLQYDAQGDAYSTLTLARAGANTGNWVTTTVTLTGARFANSQNYFSDLRLYAGGSELFVKSLVLRRASDGSSATLSHVAAPTGDGSYVVKQSRIPGNRYMYFKVNDAWMKNNQLGVDNTVYADVTYKDIGAGNFAIEYDSTDGAYTSVLVPRAAGNSGAWLTVPVTLPKARLANGQDLSADLRLSAGGTDLYINSLVLYRSLNPGSVRFKATSEYKMLLPKFDTNAGGEGYSVPATIGNVECRQLQGNGKYLYIDVSSALVSLADPNVTIAVTFWDAWTNGVTNDRLTVQWNSTAAGNVSHLHIPKTNTQAWRTVSVPVTNAKFGDQLNYKSDIRIWNAGDGSTEAVSRVDVTRN